MPCSAQVLFLEHLQRSCHLSLSLSLPLCLFLSLSLSLPLCLSLSLSPKMVSHITIILAHTCHWVYQDFHLINFSDLCSAQVLFLEHLQRSCHLSLSLCLSVSLCLSLSLSKDGVTYHYYIGHRCDWVYQDFHLINFSDLNALQCTGSISRTSSEILPLAIIVRCHLSLSHVARLWRPYVWGIYKGCATCHMSLFPFIVLRGKPTTSFLMRKIIGRIVFSAR